MTNPYARYTQINVETASSTRIVVMLYDGAIKYLRLTVQAMNDKNYYEKGRCLKRAQDIIWHLRITLDVDAAGEAGKSLYDLLGKLFDSLTVASRKESIPIVERTIEVLLELRMAWTEVDRLCQANKKAGRDQSMELLAA